MTHIQKAVGPVRGSAALLYVGITYDEKKEN